MGQFGGDRPRLLGNHDPVAPPWDMRSAAFPAGRGTREDLVSDRSDGTIPCSGDLVPQVAGLSGIGTIRSPPQEAVAGMLLLKRTPFQICLARYRPDSLCPLRWQPWSGGCPEPSMPKGSLIPGEEPGRPRGFNLSKWSVQVDARGTMAIRGRGNRGFQGG